MRAWVKYRKENLLFALKILPAVHVFTRRFRDVRKMTYEDAVNYFKQHQELQCLIETLVQHFFQLSVNEHGYQYPAYSGIIHEFKLHMGPTLYLLGYHMVSEEGLLLPFYHVFFQTAGSDRGLEALQIRKAALQLLQAFEAIIEILMLPASQRRLTSRLRLDFLTAFSWFIVSVVKKYPTHVSELSLDTMLKNSLHMEELKILLLYHGEGLPDLLRDAFNLNGRALASLYGSAYSRAYMQQVLLQWQP